MTPECNVPDAFAAGAAIRILIKMTKRFCEFFFLVH
jgi:hypothetical protein